MHIYLDENAHECHRGSWKILFLVKNHGNNINLVQKLPPLIIINKNRHSHIQ